MSAATTEEILQTLAAAWRQETSVVVVCRGGQVDEVKTFGVDPFSADVLRNFRVQP